MSTGARSQQIDVLRGISIVLVLLHHFNIAYSLKDTALAGVVGWGVVNAIVRNGNYGVTMFFVISGFLITTNAMKRWGQLSALRPLAFYRFRAARILPCLILLLILANCLALTGQPIFQNHPDNGAAVSFWTVDFAALTFWMNVLMARAGWLNYVLCVQWSLSIEEVFYLSFPILCLTLKRESVLIAVWCLFIVAGPIWRYTHQGDEAGFLYSYLACFDGIAIGCCAAVLRKRVALTATLATALQLAVATAMGLLYLAGPIEETNVFGVTLMALGTAVFIVAAHAHGGPSRRAPNTGLKAIAWCGQISYELYLFHLVILAGLRVAWPPRDTPASERLVLFVAYLLAAMAVAAIIAKFYSEPLNRRLRAAPIMDTGTGRAAAVGDGSGWAEKK